MPNSAKTILLLLCIIAVPALLMAENLDLAQGFYDIPWAAQTKNRTDLKKVGGNAEIGYYVRTEDPYEIYGEDIGRVIYGFYEGRFFSAFIDIAGKEKFDKTLAGLKNEFGPPRVQFRVGQDVYIWQAEKVIIKLKRYEKRKVHKLAFYFAPLSNQLNDGQDSAADEIILKLDE